MFHESSNHFSWFLVFVEEIMINDHFLYINHHVKSNVVYFIIYLISSQQNLIKQHLKFNIFRALNERKTRFTFSFLRFSAVLKRSAHFFYICFMNAFNCDFCVKFVYNLYFSLSTFVMHAIVTTSLIALIIFLYVVDDVSNSRQRVSFHNKA